MLTLTRDRKMKDKIVAFIGGDILATIHVFLAGVFVDLGNFGLKVLATVIIGGAGGLAGMAAKDFYPRVKIYFKRKFKTKTDDGHKPNGKN